MVRTSFFLSDFLQNPYFSEIIRLQKLHLKKNDSSCKLHTKNSIFVLFPCGTFAKQITEPLMKILILIKDL